LDLIPYLPAHHLPLIMAFRGLPALPTDAASQALANSFQQKVLGAFFSNEDARLALAECERDAADPAKGGTPQVQEYVQRLKDAVNEKLSYSGGALRTVKSVDNAHTDWEHARRLQEADTWRRTGSEDIEQMKLAVQADSKECLAIVEGFAPLDCGYSEAQMEATPAEQTAAQQQGETHCKTMRARITEATAAMASQQLAAKQGESKQHLAAMDTLVSQANSKFDAAKAAKDVDAMRKFLEQEGVSTADKKSHQVTAMHKEKLEELKVHKLDTALKGVEEIMKKDIIKPLTDFCTSYAQIEGTWSQKRAALQGLKGKAAQKKAWVEAMNPKLSEWTRKHKDMTKKCKAKRATYSSERAKKKSEFLAVWEALKRLSPELELSHLVLCLADAYLVQRDEVLAYVTALPENCQQYIPSAITECENTLKMMSEWLAELDQEVDTALGARRAEASAFLQQILEMLKWKTTLCEELIQEHQTQVHRTDKDLDNVEAQIAELRPEGEDIEPGDEGYDKYLDLLAAKDDKSKSKKEHEDRITKVKAILEATRLELQRYADLTTSMKLDIDEGKAEEASRETVKKAFTTTPSRQDGPGGSSSSGTLVRKGMNKKSQEEDDERRYDELYNFMLDMKQEVDGLKGVVEAKDRDFKEMQDAKDRELNELREQLARRCAEEETMSNASTVFEFVEDPRS